MVRKGEVVEVFDDYGGERIRVRLRPDDSFRKDNELPYAFPAIPKMLHVKPKVGETVLITLENDSDANSQRYYLGPIISQPQMIYKDSFALSSSSLLKGGLTKPLPNINNDKDAKGAIMKDDDIGIYGRKNSDIILTDNDIRIRCGARLVDENDTKKITFNKSEPAFIKLKYYPKPLEANGDKTRSTATIVGDKINLISPNGSPYINIADKEEGISDEEMRKIIETAHRLPYGDNLVEFFELLLKMFKSHTHKYHQLPPCPDGNSMAFETKFGWTKRDLTDKLLSKNIRIN